MKTKYYLIKAKHDLHTNNCYTAITDDIQPDEIVSYVELTEEELSILTNVGSLCGPSKEVETYYKTSNKIRKVLDNE